MANHFKIHELLSASELEELETFAREPGRTHEEILEWLQGRGFTVGRSSVGRWKQDFDQRLIAERMSGAGGLAKAFMDAARDGGGLQIPDAATLQLAQMIFETSARLAASGDVEPSELNQMALSLQRLMLAKGRLEKTRTEVEQRQQQAIEEASKVAEDGGDGRSVVEKVREILNIK